MPLIYNLLISDPDDEDDCLLRVNLRKPVAKRITAVPRALKTRCRADGGSHSAKAVRLPDGTRRRRHSLSRERAVYPSNFVLHTPIKARACSEWVVRDACASCNEPSAGLWKEVKCSVLGLAR